VAKISKIREEEELLTDLKEIEKDSIKLFKTVPLIPEQLPREQNQSKDGEVVETFVLRWHTNDIQMVKSKELAIRYETWYQKASALVEKYVPYQSRAFNDVAKIMESYVTLSRYAVATKEMLDFANRDHERGYVTVYLEEFASVIGSQARIIQSIISISERVLLPQPKCFVTGSQCTIKVWFNPKLFFVIIPFSTDYNDIYQIGIKEVVQHLEFECVRADEIVHTKNVICLGLCQPLRSSRFVIAELTNRNPNVLYELGLSHAFEKDVILLTQDIESIPFDLRNQSIIIYHDISDLRQKLSKQLQGLINN